MKLNIISLNHPVSKVLQSRKGLILRGSCPHSRLGHTSVIHSHSYSRCEVLPPSSKQTDISCWAVNLQFFLCVNVFGNNWPSTATRCSDESSPLPGQCSTGVLYGIVVGCISCSYVPNGVTVCSPPLSMQAWEHQSLLTVDLKIWWLSSQCSSRWFLNMFTELLLTTSQGSAFQVVVMLMRRNAVLLMYWIASLLTFYHYFESYHWSPN